MSCSPVVSAGKIEIASSLPLWFPNRRWGDICRQDQCLTLLTWNSPSISAALPSNFKRSISCRTRDLSSWCFVTSSAVNCFPCISCGFVSEISKFCRWLFKLPLRKMTHRIGKHVFTYTFTWLLGMWRAGPIQMLGHSTLASKLRSLFWKNDTSLTTFFFVLVILSNLKAADGNCLHTMAVVFRCAGVLERWPKCKQWTSCKTLCYLMFQTTCSQLDLSETPECSVQIVTGAFDRQDSLWWESALSGQAALKAAIYYSNAKHFVWSVHKESLFAVSAQRQREHGSTKELLQVLGKKSICVDLCITFSLLGMEV